MSAFSSLAPAGRFHDPPPPQRAAHRGAGAGVVSLVLMAFAALRFQSAGSAQPQGGIGLDPVRPDEESPDLAQHHRCAGAVADRRPMPLAARHRARSRWWRQALTLSSFVPEEQDEKLALIADANSLLDATLNPFDVMPAAQRRRSGRQPSTATAGKAARRRPARTRQAGAAMPAAWPMRWTRWPRPARRQSRRAPPRRWCRASRPCCGRCRIR